jgi:hypothetical protein
MDFHRLFAMGMKRQLPQLLACDGPSFDVGASGNYVASGAVALGAPDWVFPRDPIPCRRRQRGDHLLLSFPRASDREDAISFLREVERALIPERGVMNFSVPYYSSILMARTWSGIVRARYRLGLN